MVNAAVCLNDVDVTQIQKNKLLEFFPMRFVSVKKKKKRKAGFFLFVLLESILPTAKNGKMLNHATIT